MKATELQALGWELVTPGWWHHPAHGSLVKERDGKWWWYHREGMESGVQFDTLEQAVETTNDRP